MKDSDFNKRTKELEGEYDDRNNNKTSKYNNNNWMIECYFCQSICKLETHHIHWQKDCVNNRVKNKPQINKNSNYNLCNWNCYRCFIS